MTTMQPAVKIKSAGVQDASLVYEITLGAHAEYEGVLLPRPGAFEESVADVERGFETGGAAIAWVGSTPVGAIRYRPGDRFLQIGRLSVLPEYRMVRVGSSLVEFAEEVAVDQDFAALRAEVRGTLPGVVTFFQKLDFAGIGMTEHPRDSHQDVIILAKSVR